MVGDFQNIFPPLVLRQRAIRKLSSFNVHFHYPEKFISKITVRIFNIVLLLGVNIGYFQDIFFSVPLIFFDFEPIELNEHSFNHIFVVDAVCLKFLHVN